MKRPLTDIKGYYNVHNWIIYHYGRATKCSNTDCKVENPKRIEWALKKGYKYEKNISNFIMLCTRCHSKYDNKNTPKSKAHRSKISKGCIGKKKFRKTAIIYSVAEEAMNKNEIVQLYESGMPMTHIAVKYNVSRYSINKLIPVDIIRFRKPK
jgi:hypothetical protein